MIFVPGRLSYRVFLLLIVLDKIQDILKEAEFKDINIKQPQPLITIQGKRILTPGNFITLNGLPKSRKTTFMQFFIYSALSNQEIFGIHVNIKPTEEILLIDTEQSIYDFSRQVTNLKHLLKCNDLPKRFKAFLFRKYEPEIILNSIYELVKQSPPKLLFIDNLTELVYNPNDIPESKKVIQMLKKITADFDTSIINLLHLGKTNLNTLGNLGSLADRAAQSVLKVTNDKDTGTSTLEASMLRSDIFFEPLTVGFNNELKQYEQTDHRPVSSSKEWHKLTDSDHRDRVRTMFLIEESFTYSEIVEEFKNFYGVGTNTIKQQIIPYLLSEKLIKRSKGIYYKNF